MKTQAEVAKAVYDYYMNRDHEYIGYVVSLTDGRSGKIICGLGDPASPNHKILLQDLDGNEIECYHGDIQYVMAS